MKMLRHIKENAEPTLLPAEAYEGKHAAFTKVCDVLRNDVLNYKKTGVFECSAGALHPKAAASARKRAQKFY